MIYSDQAGSRNIIAPPPNEDRLRLCTTNVQKWEKFFMVQTYAKNFIPQKNAVSLKLRENLKKSSFLLIPNKGWEIQSLFVKCLKGSIFYFHPFSITFATKVFPHCSHTRYCYRGSVFILVRVVPHTVVHYMMSLPGTIVMKEHIIASMLKTDNKTQLVVKVLRPRVRWGIFLHEKSLFQSGLLLALLPMLPYICTNFQ